MIATILDAKHRFRLLLSILLLVILGMPIIEEFAGLDTTVTGLSIIVIGVLIASGRTHCKRVIAPTLAVLAIVWFCKARPDSILEGFHLLSVAALLIFSVGITLADLKNRREIDQEALAAAASAYLLFGLACGAVYAAFSVWHPGGLAFSGTTTPDLHDHVYFSFVVLTTIGFGDVVPQNSLTRSLAMLEGILGLFFIAIVISRLVSLYHASSDKEK